MSYILLMYVGYKIGLGFWFYFFCVLGVACRVTISANKR